MPTTTLFDHSLNTGETDIGADSFPLGDGGSNWAVQIVARTGSAGAFALTAAMCTLDATDWDFAPPTGTFPLNYVAKIAANNSGTYDPVDMFIYFTWDDTKCHLFNGVIYTDDAAGNQWGAQIRYTGGVADIRPYRCFTNNSFLANAAVVFTGSKPANGTACCLRVTGSIDSAFDLQVRGRIYNVATDPTLSSPLADTNNNGNSNIYAGTFSFSSRPQGVSMGDNNSATLTSPSITRIVINGLTAQISLVAGGSTVNIHKHGRRTIPVYQDTFPSAPTFSVLSGLPSGATVNSGLSTLTPGDTTSPGKIVIDCVNVTPGTYTLTLQGTGGGETDTETTDLVVTDVTSRVANTKRAVAHGSSSVDSAAANFETAANLIYEDGSGGAYAFTQYDDAFATLGIDSSWLLMPGVGQDAKAHAALNQAIANKAHYLVGGAAYYNSFGDGTSLSTKKTSVKNAYSAYWGEMTRNGIPVIFVAHQEPANAANICSGSIVSFAAGAISDTVELESGEAAMCEAGDCIYVTATDTNSLQFAEILAVSAPSVITQKFLRTNDLPVAGRAYWVGDKDKHNWHKELRDELGVYGTTGHGSLIQDTDTTGGRTPTNARVYYLTRSELYNGEELHDIWRKYANTDRFHVASEGNAAYGAVLAYAIAYMDIQLATAALSPSTLNAAAGDGPTNFSLSFTLDGDNTVPDALKAGSFMSTIGSINPSSGAFTPSGSGSGAVFFRLTYHATKDPSATIAIGGGSSPIGVVPLLGASLARNRRGIIGARK